MAQLEVNLPPVNLLNFNRLRFWMPDITMCEDQKCAKKTECYRFLAIPNEFRQSYFVGSPKQMDSLGNSDGCLYFMKATEEEKKAYNAYCIGHRNGSISQEDSSGSNKES